MTLIYPYEDSTMMKELPTFYLITPDFDGNLKLYLNALEASLINGIRLVQLRSKQLSSIEYNKLAKQVLNIVRNYAGKLILNAPQTVLEEVKADGIHFPSSKFIDFYRRPIANNYILSVACHTKDQLKQAESIKADIAIVSPIFATPSSPQGIPMGWENFSKLTQFINIPIYALGGLTIHDYQRARDLGAYGISAKRALWNLRENLC